jgi:hypothetical protein
VLKVVSAAAAFVMEVWGVYHEGEFSPSAGYAYTLILYNVSVAVALYCLLVFYVAARRYLAPFRPVFKFLLIKVRQQGSQSGSYCTAEAPPTCGAARKGAAAAPAFSSPRTAHHLLFPPPFFFAFLRQILKLCILLYSSFVACILQLLIFVIFWQGVIIAVISGLGGLPPVPGVHEPRTVSLLLQVR